MNSSFSLSFPFSLALSLFLDEEEEAHQNVVSSFHNLRTHSSQMNENCEEQNYNCKPAYSLQHRRTTLSGTHRSVLVPQLEEEDPLKPMSCLQSAVAVRYSKGVSGLKGLNLTNLIIMP